MEFGVTASSTVKGSDGRIWKGGYYVYVSIKLISISASETFRVP